MFAPLLVAPPPPPLSPCPVFRVSCPILHLALFSENDESGTTYQASRIVTILYISIRMLMCPEADPGASSGHLIASPFVIQILLLVVGRKE